MEQLVMLICCDIPFSPKHFFPHFLFIHVSMAFLKETALLNSTNTGGGRRMEEDMHEEDVQEADMQ